MARWLITLITSGLLTPILRKRSETRRRTSSRAELGTWPNGTRLKPCAVPGKTAIQSRPYPPFPRPMPAYPFAHHDCHSGLDPCKKIGLNRQRQRPKSTVRSKTTRILPPTQSTRPPEFSFQSNPPVDDTGLCIRSDIESETYSGLNTDD